MIKTRALEGDFLETHEGLIFDVKGLFHPQDRIIAYLRYIPISFLDPGCDHIPQLRLKQLKKLLDQKFAIQFEDIRQAEEVYVKLYDINSRFKILSQLKPDYIYQPIFYDFPLQAVPIKDVKTIHAPEMFLQKILTTTLDQSLKNLIDFILKGGNIPLSHIGLSGSYMVGLSTKKSDYDLIVYGENESNRVHSFLRGKFSLSDKFTTDSSVIQSYRGRSLRKLVKLRWQGFSSSYRMQKKMEIQKIHQFLIDGKDVFIRFIEIHRTDEKFLNFDDLAFKTLGRICLQGVVIDDSRSFFTPGQYSLKITDLYSQNSSITEPTIDVFTMRGRFLEQARKGDLVRVQGKLEQVSNRRSKTTSLRIVLGTDSQDSMIQT